MRKEKIAFTYDIRASIDIRSRQLDLIKYKHDWVVIIAHHCVVSSRIS